MQRAVHTRFFRLIYGSPEHSDINCGVNIRIHIVSAVWTLERLVLSCANMMAAGTSLRSVSRFNDNKINAMQSGFILNKGTQLAERPAAEFSPELLVPSFGREPDVSQVLDRDTLVFGFRRKNNPLCDSVVNDCRRSPFFAFEPFQQFCATSFTRMRSTFRAFALNGHTNLLPLLTIGVDPVRRLFSAVRGDNNISETEVNPDKFLHILHIFVGYINGLKKIKFPLFINQVRFAFDIRQVFWIMANKGHFQTTADSPYRNRHTLIRKDAAIIGDGTEWAEISFGFLVQFISIRNLAYAAHKHLSGETKRRLESVITKAMNFELVKNFILPRYFRNSITNGVRLFHCRKEQIRLFVGRQKFYFQRQFHNSNILQIIELCK